MKYTSNQA